jgi:signal transduction histidine kinase
MDLLGTYRRGATTAAQSDPLLAADIARQEQECEVSWLQEHHHRLTAAASDGLARVRKIVNNLRDFARLDEAERDEVDLNAALESTLEILRHEITAKQLDIQLNLAPLPTLVCQPAKIHQVLHSLLLNAIQASEPQGCVELRTSCEADAILVEVRDHGCGIDPAHLPHLFEPFFTTKAVGHGVGLGLATSYGIVRDHGGTIQVASQVGRGSTFRIRLPRGPVAVAPAQPPISSE